MGLAAEEKQGAYIRKTLRPRDKDCPEQTDSPPSRPFPTPQGGGIKKSPCHFHDGMYIECVLRLMPWAGSRRPIGGAGGSLT